MSFPLQRRSSEAAMAAARGHNSGNTTLLGWRKKKWGGRAGPSAKGRVGQNYVANIKEKLGWFAWWAGPNTGRIKNLFFLNFCGLFEWTQRIIEFE
jgi:hypothetical protein